MIFYSQLFIMIYGLKGNQHKSFNKRKREKKEGREGGRKEERRQEENILTKNFSW